MANDLYKDTVSFGNPLPFKGISGDYVRNIGAHRGVRSSRFRGMAKTLGSCRGTERV